MNPIINTYQMNVGNREFLLADVSRTPGVIGTTKITHATAHPLERPPVTELLYVSDEAIINMTRPAKGDEFTNKLIHQISTISICDDNIKTILSTVSDNYFTYSQSMAKSLQPFFELLSEGIYVCHESKMIPSNGAGNFFWSAYTIRHEFSGSATHSRAMGKESNYIPCFLIPTKNPSEFTDSKVKAQREKLMMSKKVGGLAYHVSGMFSALLDGHHSAAACLLNDTDFKCLVIEPLRDFLYESPEQALEYDREPRIIALSCPYVKIPIEQIPPAILESLLLRRNGVRPKHYAELRKKAGKSLRTVNRKSIPREILLKAELLPDNAAVESAHAVTELTDEQLGALLAGEIKYEDKIIISQNYYNSVITACNYLQYEDFDRFFKFAFAIIDNTDLIATHKYIIERLCGINNKKIHDFFVALIERDDPIYQNYVPQLDVYIKNYDKYISDALIDKENKAKQLNRAKSLLGGEMGEAGIAQMEAIVKASRRG
ncbi:MAG: hypothetical protein LBC82_05115 [Oscillospiraceae bacterium]|jgi:hypothetical protein|nr:hypothetical protein [Oscillospiraceae bacterium]